MQTHKLDSNTKIALVHGHNGRLFFQEEGTSEIFLPTEPEGYTFEFLPYPGSQIVIKVPNEFIPICHGEEEHPAMVLKRAHTVYRIVGLTDRWILTKELKMPTNVALHQLLGNVVVTRAITRIKTPLSRFQTFFGMQPGGPATQDVGGDKFGYDVFDRTRNIAQGRPPGTGPGTAAPQQVGHVTVSAYRSHEKVLLQEQRIFRTRPLGGNFGTVDPRGQAYVTRQQQHLAQKFSNSREFMVSRMCRGSFQVKIDGDNWVPVDSGGHFTINFQVPSSNTGNLGGNISATWANTATDIPAQLAAINAQAEEDHGRPIRHVWLNSAMFQHVLNNTKMQSQAGTANRVFTTYEPTGVRGPDGVEDTGHTAVMEAIPWITFHIYDGGLNVDGTFTKFLPDNFAIFTPDPDVDWAEWYNGSEVVAENVMAAGTERFGLSAWTTRVIDPAGFELKALDVGLPILYIPKCIYYGTIVF